MKEFIWPIKCFGEAKKVNTKFRTRS